MLKEIIIITNQKSFNNWLEGGGTLGPKTRTPRSPFCPKTNLKLQKRKIHYNRIKGHTEESLGPQPKPIEHTSTRKRKTPYKKMRLTIPYHCDSTGVYLDIIVGSNCR